MKMRMVTNATLDQQIAQYSNWCDCESPAVDDADECRKCGKDYSADIHFHRDMVKLARKGLAALEFAEKITNLCIEEYNAELNHGGDVK